MFVFEICIAFKKAEDIKNFFSHAYTEMDTFFAWDAKRKSPFMGYTREMRELSIIPVGIVNKYSIWCNNCVICVKTVIFPTFFCTIKCRHLTDQKVSSLRKLENMGSQLHRYENLQLVQNCLCWISWLTFFVCNPKRGFSSRVSGKKSGHFCACMKKNKVCYTWGRG